ncbi:hypothetical protein [Streptomyces sp. NBC_01013]|uniref:hypothetical protein n=1 Tax=Streptomyces sp. NBC_01013 TaxID=2903718 RepID=UPI00386BA519|nr:hypothetical protein OG538_35180 [Streptomyces sp. NBC_01013]
MTDRRRQGTAYTGAEGSPPPTPADMPDQQVQDGEDALDVLPPPGSEHAAESETAKPDPDEAGAGRSTARNAGVHPEHPTPDESTG